MNEQVVRGIVALTNLKPSTIDITANGDYDVTKHTIASVNVPVPDGYIVPSGTLTASRVGMYNVTQYAFANFSVPTESKEFTPTKEVQRYTPSNMYVTSIKINPIPSEYIVPTGTLEINANGNYNVTQYAYVSVDAKKNEQTKSATPTKEAQTILPDKDMVLSAVYIDAIPSEYIIPSGTLDITRNDTYDVTEVKNVVVNVPIPDGYLKPEGTLKITDNNLYEISKYQYVNVDVQTGINITDATATPSDVLKGKVAYNNDGRIEGTIETYDYSTKEGAIPEIDKFILNQFTDYYNDRVTEIGGGVFYGNTALKSINFPNVIQVGASAFANTSALTDINMPNCEIVLNAGFQQSRALVEISLPKIKMLRVAGLGSCPKLIKVYLGNDLTEIQAQAFASDTVLETLIIDSIQVPTLQNTNAFYNCNNVTIYVRDTLLEEFKSTTNWTSVADKIKPLSEYLEVE